MHPILYLERALDRVTMYRVVIYSLLAIDAYALLLSVFGIISQKPLTLILSFTVINLAAWLTHEIAIRLSKAPGNIESTAITALLLFLILAPEATLPELSLAALIAAASIALKYVVQIRLRHIANPAALALVLAGLWGYTGAAWWVGSRYLFPIVIVTGLFVLLKTRRSAIAIFYIALSTVITTLYFLPTTPVLENLSRHFLSWPTVFFAAFMLTEPLSLPSTRNRQYAYVAIAAVLSSIPFAFGPLYGTPEFALVVANIFTLIVDRPFRAVMKLVSKTAVGPDTFEYNFSPNHPVAHMAGQYLEWTLPHSKPDTRGIRRYFTISSRPAASLLSFTVRHLKEQSSFKKALQAMQPGETIYATQRAGDFTLRAHAKAHVFIAGGIGITPFVSMIRDAEARNAAIPATLFYCSKSENDIAFQALVEGALKTVHVLDTSSGSALLHETGFITDAMIQKYVPEWFEATYYISGPPGLVGAYEKLLRKMGIPRRRIVVDYFPGLA